MSNPHRYRPIDVLKDFAESLKFACTVKDFDPADTGPGAEFGRGIHAMLRQQDWAKEPHQKLIEELLRKLQAAFDFAFQVGDGNVVRGDPEGRFLLAFRALLCEIADIETGKLEV